MDNRLGNIATTRPGRLRTQDLPVLASAMVGYWKGLGVVDANTKGNVGYVRIHGPNFDITVTDDDWLRILPYLRDATLGPGDLPSPQLRGRTVAGKDFGDPTLYNRTLSTLQLIFYNAESYVQQVVTPGVTPSSIPGVFARFDASKPAAVSLSGNQVSVWADSIQGRDAYQMDPNYRPTYNGSALNGLPGIEFDGTQWLDLPLPAMVDWSVFIVGKYQISLAHPIGGFLVAAGYDGLGSGVDCLIKQNSNGVAPAPGPQGRLTTWLMGELAPISPYDPVADPDQFRLFHWFQSSRNPGGSRARIGSGPDVDLAGLSGIPPYDLSQEGWDPTRQLAGQPQPLKGAVGRYSGLVYGGPTFYLVGTICEIVVYDRALTSADTLALVNMLNTKWGGTLL